MNKDEWPMWARFASRIGIAVLVAALGFVCGIVLGALWLAGEL